MHFSDCAVHNELENKECNCGGPFIFLEGRVFATDKDGYLREISLEKGDGGSAGIGGGSAN